MNTPPPPTPAEQAAAARLRAAQTQRRRDDAIVPLLFTLGVLLAAGAYLAYLRAATTGPVAGLAASSGLVFVLAAIIAVGRGR